MNGERLIGVVSAESHNVKFSMVRCSNGNVVLESSRPVKLVRPRPGWVEVDGEDIWNALCTTVDVVLKQLRLKHLSVDDVATIGIANERDTVLAWHSETGRLINNAIHYTDTRTDGFIEERRSYDRRAFEYVEKTTGSRVTSMFSGAAKLKWIIDNAKCDVRTMIRDETLMFGTLDTWLVWRLTRGNVYVTDVTNACHTLLMNPKTLQWSSEACRAFDVPMSLLPAIRSSSELYGLVEVTGLEGLPIGSVLANHQAALYGSKCARPGQVMARYGDSCTVSCVVGTEFVKSEHGLLTTVAYKMGDRPAVYALEGWTSAGGRALEWLKNGLKIVKTDADVASLNVDASDVYFVPAFDGLAAPHWKPTARGIICGLTHYSDKRHVIRAALEAMCFHAKDVCVAFENDTGAATSLLAVDGACCAYDNLLRYQADISGVDVLRSRMNDMAVYGSAKAAALAANVPFENERCWQHVTRPTTTDAQRKHRYSKWLKAVRRSNGLARLPTREELLEYDVTGLTSSKFLSTVCVVA